MSYNVVWTNMIAQVQSLTTQDPFQYSFFNEDFIQDAPLPYENLEGEEIVKMSEVMEKCLEIEGLDENDDDKLETQIIKK